MQAFESLEGHAAAHADVPLQLQPRRPSSAQEYFFLGGLGRARLQQACHVGLHCMLLLTAEDSQELHN